LVNSLAFFLVKNGMVATKPRSIVREAVAQETAVRPEPALARRSQPNGRGSAAVAVAAKGKAGVNLRMKEGRDETDADFERY
jgi:hypothetical protein